MWMKPFKSIWLFGHSTCFFLWDCVLTINLYSYSRTNNIKLVQHEREKNEKTNNLSLNDKAWMIEER